MDSMDSKLKPQNLCPAQANANREVVTTPLFKLYQTNRPSEDGLPERFASESGLLFLTLSPARPVEAEPGEDHRYPSPRASMDRPSDGRVKSLLHAT